MESTFAGNNIIFQAVWEHCELDPLEPFAV